ncbi:putative nucleic acid-binding Zn ribbon protein [Martelella radicis]|uniref:Putative nucleic acid-binding Zn ribbon protein n=1 Tax=Martelella radicis TaxID=1397476 RepID=A0A7W6KKH1_9HYPH|nr:putative nucleic acid-binding Zn ribbon protein [Martelella radicis]
MRIYHCKYCSHHLRFGRKICSRCYQPTPLRNRFGNWALAFFTGFAVLILVALTLLV